MKTRTKIRKIKSIRKSSPFKKWDLLLYSFIVAIVFFLILFFVILNNGSKANNFYVYHGDELMLTFDFDKNVKVNEDYKNLIITTDNQDSLLIKVVNKDDVSLYNVIKVDTKNKKVSVCESNCSIGHDCVKCPAIDSDKGAIVCAPHHLKIVGSNGDYRSPVIG